MAKKHYITYKVKDPDVNITEYLRYAGTIDVRDLNHTGYVPYEIERQLAPYYSEGDALITINCRKSDYADAWIKANIKRLASFGVKAVTWSE